MAAGGIWPSPNLDPTTSTSSPPLLPTSSHCLSLDTISYIKVSPFYLSSLSFSQTVWNTLDDVEADSCLPPHFRAYCCISKYIYYFYMPFADVLLCFACPPSPHNMVSLNFNMDESSGLPPASHLCS